MIITEETRLRLFEVIPDEYKVLRAILMHLDDIKSECLIEEFSVEWD